MPRDDHRVVVRFQDDLAAQPEPAYRISDNGNGFLIVPRVLLVRDNLIYKRATTSQNDTQSMSRKKTSEGEASYSDGVRN